MSRPERKNKMTNVLIVPFVVVVAVLVNCATTLECSDGVPGGSCSLSTHNNETSTTLQEMTTLTPAPAMPPKSMDMLAEDQMDVISPKINSTEEPKGRALNFTMGDNGNILSSNGTSRDKFGDLSDVTISDDDDADEQEMQSAKILAPKYTGSNASIGICEKGGLTYENGEKLEIGCDFICTCMKGRMDCADRCSSPLLQKGKHIEDPLCREKETEDPCCSSLVCATRTDKNSKESCIYNNKTYKSGEKLENGCDSVCTCSNGKMNCTERCSSPFFRKGKNSGDPLCFEKATADPCCSTLICESDTETEPLEMCSHNNKTYNRGEVRNEGCEDICTCEIAGKWSCKPRCLPANKTSDRCVEIQDPNDSCCKKVFCDVTLDDHAEKDDEQKHKLLNAKYINETTIEVKFEPKLEVNDNANFIEASDDKQNWRTYQIRSGRYVEVHEGTKYLKMENIDDVIEIQSLQTSQEIKEGNMCAYKNATFKLGEEFNDNCTSLCVCKETGMKCLKLECPTYFGVDVLDPNCIEWETVPPNFVPSPPNCCPEELRCKSNGSCIHKGETYPNWQQLPANVTGCEQNCYCEMGNVECQNVCPPVTAIPPANLPCPPNQAMLDHTPEDDCCMYWVCNPQFLPGFPGNFPGFQQPQDEIDVHSLDALDAHTVRLTFIVPTVIVGLHGRVEVRYTHRDDNDFNNWELQVFAPPNDLIATPQLEFDLLNLKPDTEYKIRITITLRDLHNTPTSRVYKIKTPKDLNATTLPPMIPIEPELAITDINATWVTVVWRKFTQYEFQFIDGVQLRFKEIDGKIYDATPLIHRSVISYTLENLKPNTKYEIGIFFIPFPGQMTELHAGHMLHFTTANEVDTYGFNVTLEISHVKSSSVEIAWSGVPYPEDKYVNIYRAIYQTDSGKEDQSTFKIAKRDSPTRTMIKDLKSGTRYRLWLEVYLTNGKIKTSNVQDFITKPRAIALGTASQQGEQRERKGDYYGPLVIVAILASIAILSTLILLLILVRRHNQNKAAITPPTRVSQSAYDNPTYKVEIQQETMGL